MDAWELKSKTIIGRSDGPPGRWLTGDLVDAIDGPGYETAVMPFAKGRERDARALCAALDNRRVATPEPFTRTAVNPLATTSDDAAGRLATFLQMTSEGVPLLDAASPLLSGSRRWVRELVEIRKEHPSLRRGSVEAIYVEGGAACVLRRTSEETFLVVVNQESTPLTTRLNIGGSFGQVMWLSASFMLLADAAGYVSSDVPMNSIGTRISSILPMARNDTFNCRPSVPANCALNLKASRVSSSVARPIMQAAAILPLTTALRGAGVASSGSSDWRSRSPAVASRIR